MLSLATNLFPTPAPAPTASAFAAAATLGVASASRQQLPIAVLATGAPAAYLPGTREWKQPQPARASVPAETIPPVKSESVVAPAATTTVTTPTSQSVTLGIPLSSQLAAQIFAQAMPNQGEVPIVLPRQQKNEKIDPRQYVRDIRVALGDVAAARTASTHAPKDLPALNAAISAALNTAQQVRQLAAQAQAEPHRPLIGRKPSVANARGASAYQVAQLRNIAVNYPSESNSSL